MANGGISGLSFTLVNGDVTGDNIIGSADLTAVRVAFGTAVGRCGLQPQC